MFSSILAVAEALRRLLKNHKDLPSLDSWDWTFLQQLEELLRPFVYFTEHMSGKTHPLIHEVIPLMDSINRKLEKFIDDELKLDSLVYRCAMKCKPEPSLVVKLTEFDDLDPFADLFESHTCLTTQTDALDEYLAAPLVDLKNNAAVKGDPLKWWCLKLKSKIDGVDPHLARMAIDLLSIPAASTDVEHDFSRGGLMVSKRQHQLKDESVRSSMTVGSWNQQGLLPYDKLVQCFNDKPKRLGMKTMGKDLGKKSNEVVEVLDSSDSDGDGSDDSEDSD
ncbi:hypothetical protein VKT23_011644 [Stygiomarasmius scandens]|uniref:HAT C-terminal dimerisation domain-containing protein n=1 Tax=Marasmiellus scandens TaxID=2682957 RepID=A0ABR1JAB9_9AGAR